jgi:hypothetical protein
MPSKISLIIISDSNFADLVRWAELYLTRADVPFPFEKYQNIKELALKVLKNFSFRNLNRSPRLSTGAVTRPVEALYQDEFYRSLQTILNFSGKVSTEWSADGRGRVDLRIDEPRWAIELLRDGNKLKEHCDRFVDNGRYKKWIDNHWIEDWLIIDCRTSPPTPYGKLFPASYSGGTNSTVEDKDTKLWRAVFSKDYDSIEILDQFNKRVKVNNHVVDPFVLTNG